VRPAGEVQGTGITAAFQARDSGRVHGRHVMDEGDDFGPVDLAVTHRAIEDEVE